MTDRPVFRFPVSDTNENFFLVQIIPTEGSKNPLDLKLVGTEGDNVFVVKCELNPFFFSSCLPIPSSCSKLRGSTSASIPINWIPERVCHAVCQACQACQVALSENPRVASSVSRGGAFY